MPSSESCVGAGISLSLPAAAEEASSAFLRGAARRLASVGSGSSMLAQRIAGTHFLGDVEAEDDYGEALVFRFRPNPTYPGVSPGLHTVAGP